MPLLFGLTKSPGTIHSVKKAKKEINDFTFDANKLLHKNKTEHFPHIVRGAGKEKINRDIAFHHRDWKSKRRLEPRQSGAAK